MLGGLSTALIGSGRQLEVSSCVPPSSFFPDAWEFETGPPHGPPPSPNLFLHPTID